MTAEGRRPSLSDRFNRSHAAHLQSATLERLYRTAYGEDYPAEVNPNAFFSRTTLQRLVGALHVGPRHTVVDLSAAATAVPACGWPNSSGRTSSASTSRPSAWRWRETGPPRWAWASGLASRRVT
jgi:hypothetical protein